MSLHKEGDTGAGKWGTVKSASRVEMLRVCLHRKRRKHLASYKEAAGLQQDTPGLLVPFSESDLIRLSPDGAAGWARVLHD